MYQIFDNFLNEDEFKILKQMNDCWFPWFIQDRISGQGDESRDKEDTYFTHLFYDGYTWHSDHKKIVWPLIQKIKPKALIRIKGNCYMKTSEVFRHNAHTDYPFRHNGAIFYINTNNGKTILENGKQIDSVANRLLLFDASRLHQSTSCSDSRARINININYY